MTDGRSWKDGARILLAKTSGLVALLILGVTVGAFVGTATMALTQRVAAQELPFCEEDECERYRVWWRP